MLSLFLPLLLAQIAPTAPLPEADRIVHHAAIYTVDDAQPWATAMAIKDGQILYVGSNAGAAAYQGAQTEMVHVQGRMIMPGIGDSHVHLLEAHHPATGTVILESGHSLESYIPTIQAQAPNQIGTDWVIGWGFSMLDVLIGQFHFARRPVDILDDAVPNDPAIIMEETSHAMWVNSEALRAAGIDRFTPNPPGGVIMKDWWGRPNGILLDGAGEYVMDLAMERSAALDRLNKVALRIGYKHAARNGITAIADARAFWKRGYIDAYKNAEQRGVMTARTVLGLWAYPYLNDNAQIAQLSAMYERDPQSLLHISQIKIYSDGILNMTTAAILDPYRHLQLAGPLGLNYFEAPRLNRYINELEQVGFDFHIHAIGDRGARESLNAVEAAQLANPHLPPRRHHVTHLELVAPSDVPRFAQLGVIADFQMSSPFVLPGHNEELKILLGAHRVAERSLPLKDLWETDAHLVLSSDYDVGSFSPFVGMENALNRGPQSLPNVAAAVRAYTIEPAYLMRLEDVAGSLEVGKSADYLVLDRNIFQIAPSTLGQTQVLQTVFQGAEVWRAPGY
ncbi:MAG: amidohydrolase [Planctomycetes bacterium]|nr:amidohydrolase [Planctomycetota bacterium]MCP4771990.1 amidohydrolase [Planctomycetota bacterium]MCP4860270.1 amidohydrolase [Planctomycetota bacterium]